MTVNVVIAGATITSALGPPASWHSYLNVARSLIAGVDHLPEDIGSTNAAHALLCAHITECLLKAFIACNTRDYKALSSHGIRHSLSELWSLARSKGMPGEVETPEWVEQLNFLHDTPYLLRYSKGIHSFLVPNPQPARGEIKRLLSFVDNTLPADSTLPSQ